MCVNKEEHSRLWDRIWQFLKAYNVPSTVLGVAGLIGIHTLYRELKSLIRFSANITSGRTTILTRQYDFKVYTLHHYTVHSTLLSNLPQQQKLGGELLWAQHTTSVHQRGEHVDTVSSVSIWWMVNEGVLVPQVRFFSNSGDMLNET